VPLKRLVALLVALAPSVARADNVDACVDGAERSQQLRDQGKLLEAREQLAACSSVVCPKAVVKQCAMWLQEVDNEMPSLSFRARDANGNDVADVAVLVDGAARLDALDGRPMTINPGAHKITFRRGDLEVEQALVVRSGEKNRLVDVQLGKKEVQVVLAPPPPPPPVIVPPPQHPFRFPWTSGVFLGLGVAGFVTTGVLVAVAGSDASHLRATCAPSCAQSDVDAVSAKLTAANIMFGVGIGATALSALFLVIANVHHDVRVGVQALDHGAFASATGRF
jgi:hypothetical protein